MSSPRNKPVLSLPVLNLILEPWSPVSMGRFEQSTVRIRELMAEAHNGAGVEFLVSDSKFINEAKTALDRYNAETQAAARKFKAGPGGATVLTTVAPKYNLTKVLVQDAGTLEADDSKSFISNYRPR